MADTKVVVIPKSGFFKLLDKYKDDLILSERLNDVLKGGENKNNLKLNINDLKELHKALTDVSCDLHLYELLEKAIIELPTPEIQPRNPELEKRIKRLKLEQENKEYRQMTRNVDLQKRHNDSGLSDFREDLKVIKSHMIAVFNFALTVGGSFVFGYKMVEYALPQPEIAAQVLIGVLLSTIVAIADLYFLVKQIDD